MTKRPPCGGLPSPGERVALLPSRLLMLGARKQNRKVGACLGAEDRSAASGTSPHSLHTSAATCFVQEHYSAPQAQVSSHFMTPYKLGKCICPSARDKLMWGQTASNCSTSQSD